MAIIDQRMFSLVETLANSGFDWLAFELMDGISLGRPVEDSTEMLADARARVSELSDSEREFVQTSGPSDPEPILSDYQLIWAADYVSRRLKSTIDALEQSFNFLDDIEGSSDLAADSTKSSIEVVLIGPDENHSLNRAGISAAREGFDALEKALRHWLNNRDS